MADLPIGSDEGAQPIVINDPTATANVANVKASLTASVAADNSLVVALSPNSPVPVGSNVVGAVNLNSAVTNKNNVMQTGSLVTTSTTVDQVVLTYTVTTGKTLYLEYVSFFGWETSLPGNNNPAYLGAISLESPAGTKLITDDQFQGNYIATVYHFSDPLPVTSATVIRVVVTPHSTTSYTWRANFGGYEA